MEYQRYVKYKSAYKILSNLQTVYFENNLKIEIRSNLFSYFHLEKKINLKSFMKILNIVSNNFDFNQWWIVNKTKYKNNCIESESIIKSFIQNIFNTYLITNQDFFQYPKIGYIIDTILDNVIPNLIGVFPTICENKELLELILTSIPKELNAIYLNKSDYFLASKTK